MENTNFKLRRPKRKLYSREELQDLTKEDLIEKIVQLETHNNQLKNIISRTETPQNSSKRKFDFSKHAKRHVFLKLLYLGWAYQGYAVQEDTTNTIEHYLFVALEKCCLIEKREKSNYHRCGRTDKGVSAFSQVVSLDVRSKLDEEQLAANNNITEGELDYPKILNRLLPSHIRIWAWCPVPSNLSARFDCKRRTYRYYFPRGNLDLKAMNAAAQHVIGEHDFRNLCKMDVGNGVVNYKRNIGSAIVRSLAKTGEESSYDMCELVITGQAFLWHQIRCIMGILLLIGEGKEEADVLKELLDTTKYPEKPQYQLACHVPLNLFECEYDSVDWIIDTDVLTDVSRTLQCEWTICNVKATMIRSMLQHWENILSVRKQSSCLLQGISTKTYKPLFERQKCCSLEDRINHYFKKQKLEVVPSSSKSD